MHRAVTQDAMFNQLCFKVHATRTLFKTIVVFVQLMLDRVGVGVTLDSGNWYSNIPTT